ncbi:MAG: hypothetical protein JXA69_11110 [Phycisphaerae bacterium]|nr:hypothetical protein [Phycisphaerae bacterium]
MADDVLDIGSRRELFVDHYLIDEFSNTDLAMHEPVRREVALKFDNPWEGPFAGYITVLKDGDRYRMYYRGTENDRLEGGVVCYAESGDGIRWTKPDVGLYECQGSTRNNIVFKGVHVIAHNFSPFIDANPDADPQARYKALGGLYRYTKMPEVKGLYALASPDGIHWRMLQDAPVIGRPPQNAFDSQSAAFWSVPEKQYVCYFRLWTQTDTSNGNYLDGIRWIARATSPDFVHWSQPQIMEIRHGDSGAVPQFHLYTNQTSPYFRAPHIYIATPARFMPDRQVISEQHARAIGVNPKYYHDCSDTLLLTSRGGNIFQQTFLEAFMRPGIGYEHWVSRTNYAALNIVQTSDSEMSIYVNHNYAQPTSHLRRFSLRLDGFASLHAGFDDGWMLTKPLRFEATGLFINYSTSAAGGIRVEICDPDGTALPGFEKVSCPEIIGNEIDRKVTWTSQPDLAALQGKPVRLRFHMKDCDLYSFVFRKGTAE